ncbi:response regulator [Pontibacter actiniarum]|uniref:Response regulator n=1 Tax=Pontibacter actiniarum TaxID=323450 RepID=A0A1X9YT32_9BACT|nr:response regulator [Pontibacter actiniarum]ARS36023.1 response regulator [Pontibacter actiniarum]
MKKFKKILLIDDDPVSSFLNKCLIHKLGICQAIESATTEQEGIKWIYSNCEARHKGKEDLEQVLIFTDLTITIMNGFKLSNTIVELEQRQVIYAPRLYYLTSTESMEETRICVKDSFNGYLPKHLTEEDISLMLYEEN